MKNRHNKLLMFLPPPGDKATTAERTIYVPQGDSIQFLVRTKLPDGTIVDESTHYLKLSLVDTTQETPVLWRGSWYNAVIYNNEHVPGLYKVAIPRSTAAILRSGAYAISAKVVDVESKDTYTIASGYLYVEAYPTSIIRKHKDR